MKQRLTSMKSLSSRPTVLLADSHDGVLNRMCRLLGDEFEVLARISDGAEVLDYVARLRPDAVVLDFAMPTMDGLHTARELRKRGITSAIVFLSMQRDLDYMKAAEEVRAGYVLKTRMLSDLLAAIRQELLRTPATPSSVLDKHRN
jgi:DNA-binding NarL/FixJ family response regulator